MGFSFSVVPWSTIKKLSLGPGRSCSSRRFFEGRSSSHFMPHSNKKQRKVYLFFSYHHFGFVQLFRLIRRSSRWDCYFQIIHHVSNYHSVRYESPKGITLSFHRQNRTEHVPSESTPAIQLKSAIPRTVGRGRYTNAGIPKGEALQ